ncbi:MAG: hypothetical protein ACRDQZ_03150 [Mycobacteriales bacterium]
MVRLRQIDARQFVFAPISVHAEVLGGVSVPSDVPGIVLRRLTGIKGAAMRRR